MKKKILTRSLWGAPIGVVVSLIVTIVISLATGHGEYYPAPHELIDLCGSEVTAVIVQCVCSLAVGAIGGGSSVIWDTERWSLTKQTLVHFSVLVVLFVPLSYLLNWMPHHIYGALGYCAAFVAVYICIWLTVFFSMRSKIKKMNAHLSRMSADDEK